MNRLAVVVPSIRPDAMTAWAYNWKSALNNTGAHVYVVWDMDYVPQASAAVVDAILTKTTHLCWKDIKSEWKDVVHIKSDSVRNLGFLVAAQSNAEYIATLDDDVFPTDKLWVTRMIHNLSRRVNPYFFYPADFVTRGYPDLSPIKNPLPAVLLHHGLWEGVPDVYAKDQYSYDVLDGKGAPVRTIPYGQLFSMCGMNIAFHRSLLPAMYFWPQDKYRRYGDIWAGLIAKKTLDIAGFAATSGSPVVFHSRLSNMQTNMLEEEKGAGVNTAFWQDAIKLCSERPIPDISDAVRFICDSLPQAAFEVTGSKLVEWVNIVGAIETARAKMNAVRPDDFKVGQE